MRFSHPLAILLSTLISAAGASAQTVAPRVDPAIQRARPAAVEGEVADLFKAESYAVRERTMLRLWADYEQSRERVRELAKSPNPEVAQRAEWILRRWEIGLMPALPEAVQRRVAGADGQPARALLALLDGGYLREAVEVVRQQSLAAGSDEVRTQLGAVVAHRYLSLIDQARRTDSMELVLELLDHCAESTPLAVARALLLDRLGRTVDPSNLLPQCATRWPAERRDEVSTIALTVLGRFDEAIAVARRGDRSDLLTTILLLEARWTELAESARDSIDPNLPPEASLAPSAMWLVAAREAGLEKQVNEAAARIIEADGGIENELRWRALTVAGRFDAAIEVARRTDKIVAAELCATRQHHQRAFEMLGIDPSHPGESLTAMLHRAAIAENATEEDRRVVGGGEVDHSLDQLLAATRLLHMVGQHRLVVQSLRSVAALAARDGSTGHARREAAMLAMRIGYDDLIPELVIGEDDQELDDELSFHLGYILGDRSPNFFTTVRAAILRMRPEDSPRDRFRAAIELFAGRLPAGWNRQSDLEDLHEQLTQSPPPTLGPAPQRGVLRLNGNLLASSLRPSYLLGDLFARLGRGDLAKRCYAQAVEHGDLASILHFADLQLSAGNAGEALSLYTTAFENLQSDWSGGQGRFGFVEPINAPPPSASAALAGRAVALRRLGKTEQSEGLWETLRLAPLNPVADSGRGLIERLGALDQPQLQRQMAEYGLRYAAFHRADDRNFYSQAVEQASRLAAADPTASGRWLRIAVIGSLDTANLYPSGYLTIPSRWHISEALAAAGDGDGERAESHLQIALDYFPLNIAMAEEDLPKIREAGFDALADAAVDRIFQTGLAYLEEFGLDANTTNNLAWVAAINQQHYDRSLALARHAVFLAPDNVSYRDTLAELLFRLGRADEALAVQQQCLRDQPDLWHIHEQIQRFREADGE